MSAAAELFCKPGVGETSVRSLFVQSWFIQSWFASAPLCFVQLDQAGRIHALNPRLRQMIRQSCELEPFCFTDLMDPDIRPECDRLIEDTFEGKRASFQLQSSGRAHRLPAMRWTVWRVQGWNRPDWALALAEVFEDRAENEELRQAMRLEAVGRLTASVAHDFNNLLTGVLLNCDLLLASLREHEARKYAEEIRGAGIQAAGVVRQLLNVARPGTPQVRLLSLNEVIEAVQGLLFRLMRDNIHLQLRLDPKLGLVRLDSTQAQQILLNLVLNARDAMLPSGGQIVIETANCEIDILQEQASSGRLPCVLMTVRDNGTGMDAATRARMFEAFFTTKGSQGTGLGLAGVHDIVTSNGGLVHVESAPGKGTRVSVLLPLTAESSDSCSTAQTSSETQLELLPLIQEV
jgi:signal transduction histidine kinase